MSATQNNDDQKPNWEPRSFSGFSPHALRRYLAGELSDEERQAIDAARLDNAELASWLQEEEAADAAFRIQMPYRHFEEGFQKKQVYGLSGLFSKLRRLFSKWQVVAPSLAASAAVALVAINLSPGPESTSSNVNQPAASTRSESSTDTIRTKGGPSLGILVRKAEGVRQAVDGEELKAGDQIQFIARWQPGYQSAVIGSIDGRGAVSIYFAETNTSPSSESQTQLAKNSIVLDTSVGYERFFFVLGKMQVEELRKVFQEKAAALVNVNADLSNIRTLELDSDKMAQYSFLIKKVP